jgi:tight adherence protein C
MSAVVALAGLAGALLAPALADVATVLRARPRRPRRVRRVRRSLVLLLAALGRQTSVSPPRDLAARADAAGVRTSVGDLMAVKAGGAVAAVPAALMAGGGIGGRLPLVILLGLPLGAYLAPDVWLRARIRRRARVMQAELPDVLDLLGVVLDAGMTPARALAEVGRRHRGLLAAELRRAQGRAELGVPRAEVLDDLERRCPADGMPALVGALRRAERHGVPLAGTLAAQAADARAGRARRATERAARAAPQIQLVVALLLVPSAMLLVAAALAPAVLGR